MTKNTDIYNIKIKAVLKLFWEASMQSRRNTLLSLALPISQIILGVAVPFFASNAIANLISYEESMRYFWLLSASAIAGLLLNMIGIRSNMIVQANAMSALHQKAHSALLSKSVSFFNNNVGGKLVSDMIDLPGAYSMMVNNAFIKAAGLLLTMLVGMVVLLLSSPVLALVVSGLLGTVIYLTITDSKRRSHLRKQRMLAYRELTAHTSDTIVNAQTIKAFATERDESEKNGHLSKFLAEIRRKDWVRSASNESFRVSLVVFIQAIVILITILLSRSNPEAIASGIFAFTYSITMTNRFFELNSITRMVEESLVKATPMINIMAEEEDVRDISNAPSLEVNSGRINIKDISFYYPDDSKAQNVISDLSLDIKPGEKIGLVGHSGGGKSTVTKLLLRFNDVTAGKIEIDDQDISKVSQESLRRSIAYVPQEPLLFHRSIKENISYGEPKATTKDIVSAARKAMAHDFIMSLPDEYDTIVGERGVKLSGGQRQRIAIARAILRNSPILILDEATSALDSESENYIQTALDELMKNKTVIVIAHRLSTIRKMDRIAVIENGTVLESGSHRSLIKAKGEYAKLWAHQNDGFIE